LTQKKTKTKPIYSAGDLKCKAIIIITGFSLLRVIRSYDPPCSVNITMKYVMSLGTVSAAVRKSHISEENQCTAITITFPVYLHELCLFLFYDHDGHYICIVLVQEATIYG
jgi:hypothetical protein